MKKRKRKQFPVILAVIPAAVLVAAGIAFLNSRSTSEEEYCKKNAALLASLEKADISATEQQLQELQNREQSDRKHVEANEADILEKEKLSRKIADWLPSRRRIIQDIMNDLEMTSKERQRKKESCQKHIEFLINIEKYYKEQKKDEKFTEILQSIKTDAEELDAYYLKL